MRITFHGATGEVTGSSCWAETDRARVLVDFGMFQGSGEADRLNRRTDPKSPRRLDAVVLTHAHATTAVDCHCWSGAVTAG
jgi:metallo-beta-lactamase family protein